MVLGAGSLRTPAMSVRGHKRTSAALDFMSALPPIPDIISGKADIGDSMSVSPPKADIPDKPVNVR